MAKSKQDVQEVPAVNVEEVADLTPTIEAVPEVKLVAVPSFTADSIQAWVDEGNRLTETGAADGVSGGTCLIEFKAGENRTYCDGGKLSLPEEFANFGEALALTYNRVFMFQNGCLRIYATDGELRVIGAGYEQVVGNL